MEQKYIDAKCNGSLDKHVVDLLARVAVLEERGLRFESLLAASDKAVTTAMAASDRAVSAAMVASDRAISTAMSASEKAVLKAEAAADRRFESVNEFRNTLADQQTTFSRISEVNIRFEGIEGKLDSAVKALNDKFDIVEKIQITSKSWFSGVSSAWIFITGAIILMIYLFTHFIK